MFKCISIIQPWASLCVTTDPKTGKAYKQIETRSWNTKYRGPMLIHASKKLVRISDSQLYGYMKNHGLIGKNGAFPFGAIIGMVNLMDTFLVAAVKGMIEQTMTINIDGREVKFTEQELAFGDYSAGRYGWLLSDPILFQTPIPCKGNLSIWNLPVELEEAVQEQISIAKQYVDLTCMFCGRSFKGPEPKMCCNGFECGCGGQPIEPVVCSGACYDSVMKGEHFKPSLIASPGEGAVIVEGVKSCDTCKNFGDYGICFVCDERTYTNWEAITQPESKLHLPSRGIDGHNKNQSMWDEFLMK